METVIRKPYSDRERVSLSFGDEKSRTKQSFRDECNINNIMARYQKTGAIEHQNKHQGTYGFATSLDFRESLELIDNAQRLFDDLPSSIRKKFDNQPDQFLEFVQDPANRPEMAEMGLLSAEAAEALRESEVPEGDVSEPPASEITPVPNPDGSGTE